MPTPAKSSDLEHSITACQRCRDQKLKCSRDRPICVRCNRLRAHCVYPKPADRRRGRANREVLQSSLSSKQRRVSRRGDTQGIYLVGSKDTALHSSPCEIDEAAYLTTFSSGPTEADLSQSTQGRSTTLVTSSSPTLIDITFDSYPMHLRHADKQPEYRHGQAQDALTVGSAPLPPRAIGCGLLEIYYSRIYNAPLLFSKSILFQEYLEGRVSETLLKAIFALAALFLVPEDEDGRNSPVSFSELKALRAFYPRGLAWAQAATREAMVLVTESPSLAIIQALECLTIYWFGAGDAVKGDLCVSLAYRFCKVAGYGSTTEIDSTDTGSHLEAEFKRRCLWACWVSICIVAEPKPYIRAAWSEVAMLPLPGAVFNTPTGWKVGLAECMGVDWIPTAIASEMRTLPPAASVLVKMVGIWAKVQLFVADCLSLPFQERIDQMLALSDFATTTITSALSSSYRSRLQEASSEECLQQLLMVDALLHLSQVSLHSTIVPLFSNLPSDPATDVEAVRNSAAVVLDHAEQYAALMAPYYNGKSDATCLAPLVGYGAFISGAVLLAFETISQAKDAGRPCLQENREVSRIITVRAIVRLLNSMRTHWKMLQTPWKKLKFALESVTAQCSGNSTTAYEPHSNTETEPIISGGQSAPLAQDIPTAPAYSNVRRETLVTQMSPHTDNMIQQKPPPDYTSFTSVQAHSASASTGLSCDHDLNGINISSADTGAAAMAESNGFEDEWWVQSFAEAGHVVFSGMEPISLLQSHWNQFC